MAAIKQPKEENLVLYGAAILAGGLVAYKALNGASRAIGKFGGTVSRFPKQIEKSITVNRSIIDVYAKWRETEIDKDAVVGQEINHELIRWTLGKTSWEVSFKRAPGGRGTEILVKVRGGKIKAELVKEEMRQFKMLIETGEIATTEGQPKGA